jgi:hypothetical protein
VDFSSSEKCGDPDDIKRGGDGSSRDITDIGFVFIFYFGYGVGYRLC